MNQNHPARPSLSEERRIDVGPVDIGVTACARGQLGRSCTHAVNGRACDGAVALVAQGIDPVSYTHLDVYKRQTE